MVQKKSLLSLYVVVHNEEKTIKKCLEAVADLVDEIVIVDGESTDDTVKIAESFGKKVHVFHEKNPLNFIDNKQKALGYVTGEWILELDADEIVTLELAKEIATAIKSAGDKVGFYMPRLNHFLGDPLWKGGQYPDLKLRLYRNGAGAFAGKSVHDTLQLFEVDGKLPPTGTFINPLLHYPYATLADYMRKTIQYAQFEATKQLKEGAAPTFGRGLNYFIGKPFVWFFMTYARHRGYKDGYAGFVFSLFSAIRYWFEYTSLYEQTKSSTRS